MMKSLALRLNIGNDGRFLLMDVPAISVHVPLNGKPSPLDLAGSPLPLEITGQPHATNEFSLH